MLVIVVLFDLVLGLVFFMLYLVFVISLLFFVFLDFFGEVFDMLIWLEFGLGDMVCVFVLFGNFGIFFLIMLLMLLVSMILFLYLG